MCKISCTNIKANFSMKNNQIKYLIQLLTYVSRFKLKGSEIVPGVLHYPRKGL